MKRLTVILAGLLLAGCLWADVIRRVDLNLVKDWIQSDYARAVSQETSMDINIAQSYEELSDYARRCNNNRIRLYSCKSERLFETTYYLQRVKTLYRDLEVKAQPQSARIDELNRDILRYQLLMQTLRCMPPALPEDESVELLIPDSVQLLEGDTLLHELIAGTESERGYNSLTAEEQEVRDTCMALAHRYITHLKQARDFQIEQTVLFAQLRDEFSSTSEYADHRYSAIQESIFGGGQIHFRDMITRLPELIRNAYRSSVNKYAHVDSVFTAKELWVVGGEMAGMLLLAILIIRLTVFLSRKKQHLFPRIKANPAIFANALYMVLLVFCLMVDVHVFHYPLISVNGGAFLVLIAYILMIQTSLLLREKGERASCAIRLYVPCIAYCLLIVFFRFFFVTDPVIELTIFPTALICFVWQMVLVGKYWNRCSNIDSGFASFSTVVFLVMTILSACGYVFLSMEIMFWWHAQQIALAFVIGLYFLMKRYMPHVDTRKKRYIEKKTGTELADTPESVIEVTWFVDMLRMAVIPMMGILTLPACVYAALGFFHGGDQFISFFHKTLYSVGTGEDLVLDISLYNLVLAASLYFVFKYLQYVAVSIFLQVRIRSERARLGVNEVKTNQVNLGLGSKVIAIITWGMYIITVCMILNLPLQSVTVVLAGMAAGLSFAMQEILNNFFYGMQLLSGHLRVGDYLICDEYRGYVTAISYQTTQICTETGADVSFTNKDLFSKNFQNLTKQNPYEVSRVYFDVAYGSDIHKVEKVAREVIFSLNNKDKYGRQLLALHEIRIEMNDLGASGIQMDVRFGVLAEKMTWFKPVLRKAIYDRLIEENIDVPFNQLDVHIVQSQEKEASL